MRMNTIAKAVGVFLAAGMLITTLPACQQQEGPLERAGKEVDQAAEKVGEQVEKAGENIQDAAQDAKK
jgi:hypothetical protein